MVAGAAIDKGVGAAGVVAHHAAYAAAVAGGGFGTEEKPVGFEEEVEFVAHHAGLDPYPALLLVELEYVVEVPTNVYYNAVAHHLTGYAGAARAGDKAGVAATGLVD